MQTFITDLAELAEHLKVAAGLGQDAAGFEEQLIEITLKCNPLGPQFLGNGSIAAAFMDAVFLIHMNGFDLQLPA